MRQLPAYSVPPEVEPSPIFSAPSPREIPDVVRRGPYVRARWAKVWTPAFIGSSFVLSHDVPFIKTLSLYLLPLAFLNWIGVFLLFIALVFLLINLTTWGSLIYIRLGLPITGRVLEIGTRSEGTGALMRARYFAEVEYLPPGSNQTQSSIVWTPDNYSIPALPKIDPGVAVGDYVTLVYLPEQLQQSLQLYDWLALDSDHDVLRMNDRRIEPLTPLNAMAYVIFWTAMVWGLIAFLYAFSQYAVLDSGFHWCYLPGIGVTSVPLLLAYRKFFPGGIYQDSEIKRFLVPTLVILFLSGTMNFAMVYFVNGYFDDSPPQLIPVEIVRTSVQIKRFLLRSYVVVFQIFPKGVTDSKMVTIERMSLFGEDQLAVIDIGRGRLGLPWLRDFYPILWVDVPADQQNPILGEIKYLLPNGETPIRIAPLVWKPENVFLPPPQTMLVEVRRRKIADLRGKQFATIVEELPLKKDGK